MPQCAPSLAYEQYDVEGLLSLSQNLNGSNITTNVPSMAAGTENLDPESINLPNHDRGHWDSTYYKRHGFHNNWPAVDSICSILPDSEGYLGAPTKIPKGTDSSIDWCLAECERQNFENEFAAIGNGDDCFCMKRLKGKFYETRFYPEDLEISCDIECNDVAGNKNCGGPSTKKAIQSLESKVHNQSEQ